MTTAEFEELLALGKLKFEENGKRHIDLNPRDLQGLYEKGQMDMLLTVFHFYHNKESDKKDKLTKAQDLLKEVQDNETL